MNKIRSKILLLTVIEMDDFTIYGRKYESFCKCLSFFRNRCHRLLEITLSANRYKILQAGNGKGGLIDAATYHPSLIILDLGLPDIDGKEILKKLREWFFKPIIVLSVRSSEEDIIKTLDNGANPEGSLGVWLPRTKAIPAGFCCPTPEKLKTILRNPSS